MINRNSNIDDVNEHISRVMRDWQGGGAAFVRQLSEEVERLLQPVVLRPDPAAGCGGSPSKRRQRPVVRRGCRDRRSSSAIQVRDPKQFRLH